MSEPKFPVRIQVDLGYQMGLVRAGNGLGSQAIFLASESDMVVLKMNHAKFEDIRPEEMFRITREHNAVIPHWWIFSKRTNNEAFEQALHFMRSTHGVPNNNYLGYLLKHLGTREAFFDWIKLTKYRYEPFEAEYWEEDGEFPKEYLMYIGKVYNRNNVDAFNEFVERLFSIGRFEDAVFAIFHSSAKMSNFSSKIKDAIDKDATILDSDSIFKFLIRMGHPPMWFPKSGKAYERWMEKHVKRWHKRG